MNGVVARTIGIAFGRSTSKLVVTLVGVALALMMLPACSSGQWSCKGSQNLGNGAVDMPQPASTHEPKAIAVKGITYVDAGGRSTNLVYPVMEDLLSTSTEASYWVIKGDNRIAELWLAKIKDHTPTTMTDLRYDIAYPDRILFPDSDGRQPDTRTINGVEVFYVYGSAEGVSLNGGPNPHDHYSWYQGDTLAGVWMEDSSYREDVCEFVQAYVEQATE